MTIKDAAWLCATNLIKNPLRTILTILGLGVGIAAVMTVLTLGNAGQTQVEHEIGKLGVNKVWIRPDSDEERFGMNSAEQVAAATGAASCAAAYTAGAVWWDERILPVSIAGYDQGAQETLSPVVSAGRWFNQQEYNEGTAVAVIDEALAESMGDDVLGRRIALGARNVTIIGVMTPSVVQASGMVVLPLKTLLDTYADAFISEVTVNVPADRKAEAVSAMALSALGEGFQATTLEEEIDAARSVIRIFVMVLACVAAVCMLTGGIGVMNILLVSVRERRNEIGLMKALGGTSGQIAVMFLMEAVGYSLLGGLLGLALGSGLIFAFGKMIGLSAGITVSTAVPLLVCAGALGMLFGVFPAVKASGMLPVEALKQE